MVIYRNGSYFLASGTRDAFGGLSDALVREGYAEIVVNDGDREAGEQEAGFRLRYRPALSATDRGPFGDRRYWPGHGWWVRTMAGGVMGVPGSSNHERRRSGDLGYPYNSDTTAHRRAKVLARNFNITCEGENFSEKWHWTHWGLLGTIGAPAGSGSAPFTPEPVIDLEDIMSLRIISCPAYVAAGKQVVHNGSAVFEISAAHALDLRQAGVQSHDYSENYKFSNEIATIWELGGMEQADAAKRAAELIAALG